MRWPFFHASVRGKRFRTMYCRNLPACGIQGKLLVMQVLREWRVDVIERAVEALQRWGERRAQEKKPEHLRTGVRGERAAYFYLLRKGFTVVARRWNDGPLRGDVDLIAWDGEVLCFVEVKTRSSREFGPASLAVDREKRRMLRRMARQYLRQLPEAEDWRAAPPVRFDIAVVYELPGQPREVRLIPAAFGWEERDD